MIKKTILMLLVLVGGVMTANADWYVSGVKDVLNSSEDWGQRVENKMTKISDDVYALIVENKQIVAWDGDTKKQYGVKITDGTNWYPDGNLNLNFNSNGTYTIVYFFNTTTKEIRFISTPMLRWNLGNNGNGNWDWGYDANSLFTKVDPLKWTYELSADDFNNDTEFRIYSSLWDKSAYPEGTARELVYGGVEISSAYFNYTSDTQWSWRIAKPSYDFEKVVITATYKPFETTNNADFGQWVVRADAYVSPTIKNEYGTYSVAAPLDLSKAEGVTAYYAESAAGGKVTMTKLESAVDANTGLFLAKGEGSISIPVAASGTNYTTTNLLKAGTGAPIVSTDDTYYYGFQTKDTGTGFYKITSSVAVPVGKAYLELAASEVGNAPSLSIELDGETTGIKVINWEDVDANNDGQVYDLQGRRVYQPTTGIFIKNGKKVIVK